MWGMNRLGPSLVAGAAAAGGLFLIQLGSGVAGGGRGWIAFYWILCAAVFSAAGSASRRGVIRRLGIAALGIGIVLAGWVGFLSEWNRLSLEGMTLLALGLTAVFGGVRSGAFDADANLNLRRVLLVEGALGLTALIFAGWLSSPAPWGPALSIWGFALVQSLYGCIPETFLTRSRLRETSMDAFDAAFSKLNEMLRTSTP